MSFLEFPQLALVPACNLGEETGHPGDPLDIVGIALRAGLMETPGGLTAGEA